ncbi:MqnA/MqnD/SBP family protein [Streptomyces sp. NPDC004647]|uniref:menaquinone biosynthesis protein n=1 Tax=Streptomyces sp. NPDC004647 TaxID=3154671 RepID=UPI0033BDDB5A
MPAGSSERGRHAIARVGDISFLNCAPVRWGLADSGAAHQLESLSAAPEQLAAELLAGRLDISPVSLVRYLKHADELLLLPGLAIGSDGPVRSCHLVSRLPLKELDGKAVALSNTSRTTVLLVRMLLEDAVGIRPDYLAHHQDLEAMSGAADAAVLIGDDALRLNSTRPAGLTLHDTGAMWRSWTGLPMVFAVWAVRREFAAAHPDRVRAVHSALLDAVLRARGHPDAVAAAANRASATERAGRLGEQVLADYYHALDYSFGERQFASVREFARRAAARGEVPADVEPRCVPDLFPEPRPEPGLEPCPDPDLGPDSEPGRDSAPSSPHLSTFGGQL